MQCEHFGIKELIPPPEELPERLRRVYESDPDRLFRCFPWRLLVTLDQMRKLFGKTTVNSWSWGGELRFCGYRPMNCDVGAELSEHRFFRAGDLHFQDVSPAEIWAHMLENPGHEAFRFIERIEAYTGMTWVHIDLGQHDRNGRAIRVVTVKDNRAGLPEYITKP